MNESHRPPRARRQAPPEPAPSPVPSPPHPTERHEPLPWQHPKPAREDPDALSRVAAIMASPSYRRPDQDLTFLASDDVRGVRLELDYLKPERYLERQGVCQSIVVFGSTRIPEPDSARARVADLEARLASSGGDPAIERKLSIARRLLEKSRYYEEARRLGALVGQAGGGPEDCRLVVVTGGSLGALRLNNAALDAADVLGVQAGALAQFFLAPAALRSFGAEPLRQVLHEALVGVFGAPRTPRLGTTVAMA